MEPISKRVSGVIHNRKVKTVGSNAILSLGTLRIWGD